MKLGGITVVLLGFGLGPAQAQSWQVGARAGLVAAGITPGWVGSDMQQHLGGSAGVLARYRFSEHFSLQPELLYTLAGYQYRYLAYPHAGVYFTTTVDLHYLALPLLVSHRWGRVFTEAGPQLSWLMRAQARPAGTSLASGNNVTPYYTRLDAGVAAGVGWGSPQGLLLGLRYHRGLTAVMSTAYDRPSYNQSLQLYAGYTFSRATAAGR